MARTNKKVGRWLKRIAVGVLLLGALAGLVLFLMGRSEADAQGSLVEDTVARGDLELLVSCTGTLSAVETVDIGAQVSGTIEAVHVDYNDEVVEGQVLLELETTLFEMDVKEAKATVSMNKAELKRTRTDLQRIEKLHEKGYATDEELLMAQTQLQSDKASLVSAKARSQRSETQMDYTVIKSPIDGTVIARNVEKGQTIVSSFSAPSLFIIAADLSAMQIEASVDETDIGLIHEGQQVRFTVQAHQGKTYEGKVRQIRLSPEVLQNVVHYTVVVDAANEDGSLLPGMTATVDIVVESRKDVLLVPTAAISFDLSPEMMGLPHASGLLSWLPFGSPKPGKPPGESGAAPHRPGPVPEGSVRVWVIEDSGRPFPVIFSSGLTNGAQTEVLGESELEAGMTILIGYKKGMAVKQEKTRLFSPPKGGPPPRM